MKKVFLVFTLFAFLSGFVFLLKSDRGIFFEAALILNPKLKISTLKFSDKSQKNLDSVVKIFEKDSSYSKKFKIDMAFKLIENYINKVQIDSDKLKKRRDKNNEIIQYNSLKVICAKEDSEIVEFSKNSLNAVIENLFILTELPQFDKNMISNSLINLYIISGNVNSENIDYQIKKGLLELKPIIEIISKSQTEDKKLKEDKKKQTSKSVKN